MRSAYSKSLVALGVLLMAGFGASAQNSLAQKLEALGLEQIRVVSEDSQLYLSYQDPIFRDPATGISYVLELARQLDSTATIHLLLEEDGVPQAAVTAYGHGGLELSYDTGALVEKLEGVEVQNRRFSKLDLVLYPELFLENSWFTKLYGVAINISPALEWSLWKGATATAQLVVPIYTNMSDEKQYIRPGVVSLRQSLRLSNQLYGELSVGNFTDDRMGVDATLNYYTSNGRWNAGARAGLTGSSTFYGGEWVVSEWKRVTWSGWVSYFEPHYMLQMKLQAMQMIYGDKGIRAEMSRYFGNVRVGFYAQVTGGEENGGFNFTIPLPWDKRPRRNKGFRVSYPDYFHREYKARSGKVNFTGFDYQTRPDDNSLNNFYNPVYLEHEIKQQY